MPTMRTGSAAINGQLTGGGLKGWGKLPIRGLLKDGKHREIAAHAVAIEARTNLLFSFQKMAVRDAIKPLAGARAFAQGLYDFLHGTGEMERRFTRWCEVVAGSPAADPRSDLAGRHGIWLYCGAGSPYFLKPTVTKRAAEVLGLPFEYRSRPDWEGYAEVLRVAGAVRKNLRDLHPRDMIQLQQKY
jgi:hypothetical protein